MSNHNSGSGTSFDPQNWTDIFPALRECAIGSRGQFIVDEHCQILRRHGESMGADDATLEATEQLARGYDDLVVLLYEPPTDGETPLRYEETLADETYPRTIGQLDQSLRFAFQGQRNVENTIVLDSGMVKEPIEIFSEILSSLHPKVVILCRFQKNHSWSDLLKNFRSFVTKNGHMYVMQLGEGDNYVGVPSFHPMYFTKLDPRAEGHGVVQEIAREYLFDFTFIAAANALAGRVIRAEAVWDLLHHAEGDVGLPASGISFRTGIPPPISEDMSSLNGVVQAVGMRQEVLYLILCYRIDCMNLGNSTGYQSDAIASRQDVLEKFREKGIVLISENGLLWLARRNSV